MNFTPSIAALSLLCATAACGSSVETDDGSGGTTSSGSTAASVTAASTGAGPATTAPASTSGSANGGGYTVGSGGSGDGGDVSTGEGGAITTGEGGFGEGGVGPGPGAGGSSGSGEPFLCGEVECGPDEQCCGTQQGTLSCISADEPCDGAVLACRSAANCEGDDICCLEGDLQNAESRCTDVCEPTQAGPLQLCETAEECVEDVPCMEAFGGYKVCSDGFP